MRRRPTILGKPVLGAAMAVAALAALAFVDWRILSAIALAAIAICAWEGGGALRLPAPAKAGLVVAIVAAAPSCWFILAGSGEALDWFFTMSLLLWLVVIPLWLAAQARLPAQFNAAILAMMLVSAWLGLTVLAKSDRPALIAGLGLVWLVDSAAWLAGSRLGRHQLAPVISATKSWEGVIGALLALLLFSAVVWALHNGPYPLWTALFAGVALGALAVVGDLAESLLKRQAGQKDSGYLLGSHGGVLDRVDSWLPTLPFIALLSAFAGNTPL